MSDVRINTRSPYYIEANPTEPTVPETPTVPDPPANIPPTVTIVASNTNPYVGETVTLTAVATDSDGTIVSYLWGGTTTPQISDSIDVTSSIVESKIFNVAVTDDDGDVGLDQITINWQEIPEQTTNTDLDVYCGDVVNEGSFTGTKTYNLVGVGNKIGDVEIEFLGGGFNQNIPVLFDMSWNGATVSTGYIGYVDEAQGLSGVDNTGEPTTKGEPTTLTIFKSAATPTQVTLTATPFGTNDTYSFRLNCPDVEATETFYHTLTGTCTTGDTTFTYTDVNGDTQTVVLANGETQLVSAQDGTVVTSVCTGTAEKGGQSFDLGVPELTLNDTLEINIIFDDSGSMNDTLEPLKSMADGTLKNILLPYYNNDNVEYNKRVRVMTSLEIIRLLNINVGSIYDQNNRERFLKIFSSLEKRNPDSTKVVNLYFHDETLAAYLSASIGEEYSNASQTYIDDLAEYRTFLSNIESSGSYGTNLSTLVKVDWDYYRDDWRIANDNFLSNIYNGSNGFSGSKGLSDRSEATIYTGVKDGVKYSDNPNYYSDIILDILRNYGYNI